MSENTRVQALEEVVQGVFRLLDAALDDGVLSLDLALGQPYRQLLDSFCEFRHKVEDNEAFHPVPFISTDANGP